MGNRNADYLAKAFYTSQNECLRGYTGISLSVHVSVCVQNTTLSKRWWRYQVTFSDGSSFLRVFVWVKDYHVHPMNWKLSGYNLLRPGDLDVLE